MVSFPLTDGSLPVTQLASQHTFTSWLLTTFKLYKENAGMSNPGLGEKPPPFAFPTRNLTGAKLQSCCCCFFLFDSQGQPDRDRVSESSSPIRHQSCGILTACLSPPLGTYYYAIISDGQTSLGFQVWVCARVESFPFLTTPDLPPFPLIRCLFLSSRLGSFLLTGACSPTLYLLLIPERRKGRRWDRKHELPADLSHGSHAISLCSCALCQQKCNQVVRKEWPDIHYVPTTTLLGVPREFVGE